MTQKHRRGAIIIVLFTLIGGFFISYALVHQAAVSVDSIAYMTMAKSIAKGDGWGEATHHPPGYPFLLAIGSLLVSGDMESIATITAIISYMLILALTGVCAAILTRFQTSSIIAVSLISLCSGPFIDTFHNAWSEAPYCVFSIGGLICWAYGVTQERRSLMLAACLLIGSAIVTRYVGVTLLPVMGLIYLVYRQNSIFKRMIKMSAWLLLSALPLIAIISINAIIAGNATNRSLAWHPIEAWKLKKSVIALHDVFLNAPIPLVFRYIHFLILLTVVVFLIFLLYRKGNLTLKKITPENALLISLIVYPLIYLIFVILTICFADYSTPMDYRMLTPIAIPMTLGVIWTIWASSQTPKTKWIWRVGLSYIFILCLFNLTPVLEQVEKLHEEGAGFTAVAWDNSRTLLIASRIQDAEIFTNDTTLLDYKLKRKSHLLPVKFSNFTQEANESYEDEFNHMIEQCRSGKAYIIFFHHRRSRIYLTSVQEIIAQKLPPVALLNDSVIWGEPKSQLSQGLLEKPESEDIRK